MKEARHNSPVIVYSICINKPIETESQLVVGRVWGREEDEEGSDY